MNKTQPPATEPQPGLQFLPKDEAFSPALASQADAWHAVCAALNDVAPDWMDADGTATDAAVLTIRKLAASHSGATYCETCEQTVTGPCASADCSTPDSPVAQPPALVRYLPVQITVQGNRINSIQYETAACLIPDGRHDLFLTSHWREPFGADLSELEQHTYYTIANRMAGKHRDDTNTVYVTLTDAAALFTRQQHERDAARKDAEYWRNLVAAHVAAKGGPTLK